MPMTLQDALRRMMQTSGQTRAEISRATGLSEAVLSRFTRGTTDLSGKNIDILAAHLRLRLVRMDTTGTKARKGK